MKKLLILFIGLSGIALGQTSISSGNVSGIWTAAGSPYNIMGGIQVPAGSTLVIQPGVTVNFQGHYKLIVKGTLVAVGSLGSNIVFTAANTITGWFGIRIDGPAATQDSTLLRYCRLEFGIANGSTPDEQKGGAIYIKNFSKVSIHSCTITNNKADSGGVYCENSNIGITNNIISSNTTNSYNSPAGGGGLYLKDVVLSMTGNVIQNNSSNDYGGGVFIMSINIGSTVTVNSNTLSGNNSVGFGGGLCYYSQGTISNNKFLNNTSQWNGGGLYCNSIQPNIANNLFSNNVAQNGGAINVMQAYPLITDNVITNNRATNFGGGIVISLTNGGTPSVINNVISNNSSAGTGGGLMIYNSNPKLTNNTIVNNKGDKGGGICCDFNSSPTIKNCILYSNAAISDGAQVYLSDDPSDPSFSFCNIEGGQTAFGLNGSVYTGTYTNCISASPLFVQQSASSGTVASLSIDLSLQSISPCIDAGDLNGSYPIADIAGNLRVGGPKIDIGAYEFGTGPAPVSIYELAAGREIVLFPNPFSVSTVLKFREATSGSLLIYNQAGQEVKRLDGTDLHEIIIQRDRLDAGLYFISWRDNAGHHATGKLIIE